MTDPFTTPRPALTQRPPSRREVLWKQLEELHAQLQLPPPTETYTIDELEAAVGRFQTELEQRAS